jgi:hypothetical protein
MQDRWCGFYTLGTNSVNRFTNSELVVRIHTIIPTCQFRYRRKPQMLNRNLATSLQLQLCYQSYPTGNSKLSNTAGFSGGSNTATSSTNNPIIILENNSTIEYAEISKLLQF